MRLFCFLLLVLSASPASSSPLGLWVVPGGDAVISVEADELDYRLRLIALIDPAHTDVNNPDRVLRGRSLADAVIGDEFRLDDGVLKGGLIYDPDSGKTYKCRIEVQGDGSLSVTGYIGIPKFGRSQRWRRFDEFKIDMLAMIQAVHDDE